MNNRKRTATLTIRLTELEKAALRHKAARAKMSLTDFVTSSALRTELDAAENIKPLLAELGRIGRTLDRLASGDAGDILSSAKLQENDDGFCEKLASAINTVLEKQTIQISKGLFRYAVELEIIMRMMAESGKFEPETLTAFRREAVNNVRRTRGKVRLDSYFNRKDTDSL